MEVGRGIRKGLTKELICIHTCITQGHRQQGGWGRNQVKKSIGGGERRGESVIFSTMKVLKKESNESNTNFCIFFLQYTNYSLTTLYSHVFNLFIRNTNAELSLKESKNQLKVQFQNNYKSYKSSFTLDFLIHEEHCIHLKS